MGENAIFTDRCVAIVGFGTSEIYMATCSGTSGSVSQYTSADCSGTPTSTEDADDDACISIIECSGGGGGGDGSDGGDSGSSASVPAALLAMAVSAIALIA